MAIVWGLVVLFIVVLFVGFALGLSTVGISVLLLGAVGVASVAVFAIQLRKAAKRREALQQLATELGFAYDSPATTQEELLAPAIPGFQKGHSQTVSNTLVGTSDGAVVKLFDFQYSRRVRNHDNQYDEVHAYTCLMRDIPRSMSYVRIAKRPSGALGSKRGGFGEGIEGRAFKPASEELRKAFEIQAKDETEVEALFSPALVAWLLSNASRFGSIELVGSTMLQRDEILPPQKYRDFIAASHEFIAVSGLGASS